MKLELLRCISSFVFFFLSKSKTDDAAEEAMNKMFKILCSQENDNIRPKTFTHFGRNISFAITCGQVLDSTFDELCDRVRDNWNVTGGDDFLVNVFFQPLGASDYLQLTQYFHTILIRDIPQLNLRLKSQTRRFITLIDTLYDNRVRVSNKFILLFDVEIGYPD
jgi:peroxisome-assembly ATPase